MTQLDPQNGDGRDPSGEIARVAPLRSTATATPSGLRVLVVDDNPDAADVLAEALREFGHEVAIAHDGPQALALVPRFRPDTALLDIGLPVMDGYELGRKLRETLPADALRLIAITGYGQDTDKARSREAGFDLHLVKPVDLGAVATLLRETSPGRGNAPERALSG